MRRSRLLLFVLALWPGVLPCQRPPVSKLTVSYWDLMEDGLPSVQIIEAVLLHRRRVLPDSPPAQPDLESVLADSGARVWLRARLEWLMVDEASARGSLSLTGLRGGAPADSADAVVSAILVRDGKLGTEQFLLKRRPPAGPDESDRWVVVAVRDSGEYFTARPAHRRTKPSLKADSLLVPLSMGRAAAAGVVRQVFTRNGLVPLQMTPSIIESELARKSVGIGCASASGCIRAIVLGDDPPVSVLLLGVALTGDDQDTLLRDALAVRDALDITAAMLFLGRGWTVSDACCGIHEYLKRVDEQAGGTRGRVWKRMVEMARQLDSIQVAAPASSKP